MSSCRPIISLLVLTSGFVSGCGGAPPVPQGIIVTGRIVKNGQPLKVERPEVGLGMVQITMIPVDSDGIGGEGAQADKEGCFEIRGPGKGIPPKKYKLAVRQWKSGVGTKDELEGRFTPENTPIIVEVPADAVDSKHDLGGVELMDYMEKRS